MEQIEAAIVGSVTRSPILHAPAEMRCCRTKGHACRVALIHSGFSQETVADRMGVTGGYLSLLLSGKRRWTDDMQRRFIRITGSLAPLQWDAEQQGVELYVDPVKQRLAQLEAEKAEILRSAA